MRLKIPPPLLFFACVILIGLLPPNEIALPLMVRNFMVGSLVLIATLITGLSLYAFYQTRTTLHPRKLEKTSSLITTGIFRFSRNPMYLSLVIWLLAWTLFLANLWGLIVIVGFMRYLTQFQIKPEEQLLEQKFGHLFLQYKQSVRRWI
ncbi:protein-S-isoprenylcysteine O-methyltransferase Ste14 [Pasteurella langaaensis DSM 22999]|uniref:Protein-S-isoprenylcysteine O-methyltransferase Ste14 n=1 Tax=Alitibacter langaaensis DSM 22999 TaxID=1122935 RepID=A0A2U0SNY3_9PAST|nr:isoprenylcysteine carboxylmethyltransferase family protein [Pasteurella langaaensis]PVX33048.1 protein-S-isoprenylcysteine O-methyltransferase Ste14 [Pasteurella langaaensis DSM 22999]